MKDEELMASVGNWDEKFDNDFSDDSNTLSFMEFKKPGKYQVRFVGDYIKFMQHWNPPFSKPIRTHASYKDKDPAWIAGFFPKTQFAIHVIDRQDNTLKILQRSRTFLKHLMAFRDIEGILPTDEDEAPDFVITVEWPEGDKKRAEYSVTGKRKASPLTEAEKTMFEEKKIDLSKRFAPFRLSYIQEQWDSLPEDKKQSPQVFKNKENEDVVNENLSLDNKRLDNKHDEHSNNGFEDLLDIDKEW